MAEYKMIAARVVLSLVLLGGMPACGGESGDDPEGTENSASAGTEEGAASQVDDELETPAAETGETCDPASVAGVLRVGDSDVSLEGANLVLDAAHTAQCVASLDIAIEAADGCAMTLSASSVSEAQWSLNAATLQGCGTAGGDVVFQADSSAFGLLASPDLGDDTSCIDGEALAMAGRLVFSGPGGEVIVHLDGIVLAGGFRSEAGDGLACSPVINSCESVSCGQDEYGIDCGGCEDGTKCIDGECKVWNCPPEGPFGTTIGTQVMDLEFMDCDGNVHSLQDLCGAPAGLFNMLAGY